MPKLQAIQMHFAQKRILWTGRGTPSVACTTQGPCFFLLSKMKGTATTCPAGLPVILTRTKPCWFGTIRGCTHSTKIYNCSFLKSSILHFFKHWGNSEFHLTKWEIGNFFSFDIFKIRSQKLSILNKQYYLQIKELLSNARLHFISSYLYPGLNYFQPLL